MSPLSAERNPHRLSDQNSSSGSCSTLKVSRGLTSPRLWSGDGHLSCCPMHIPQHAASWHSLQGLPSVFQSQPHGLWLQQPPHFLLWLLHCDYMEGLENLLTKTSNLITPSKPLLFLYNRFQDFQVFQDSSTSWATFCQRAVSSRAGCFTDPDTYIMPSPESLSSSLLCPFSRIPPLYFLTHLLISRTAGIPGSSCTSPLRSLLRFLRNNSRGCTLDSRPSRPQHGHLGHDCVQR